MSRLLLSPSPPVATVDTRITSLRPLLPPACLLEEIPTPSSVAEFVTQARKAVTAIVRGNRDGEIKDDRLLVVIGPCSIHDVKAAIEYANKLRKIAEEVKQDLFITMRVYFEKPRTRVGWKGLINDPYLDGTFAINAGLRLARRLMLDLNLMGLPVAAEMLDTITPQFIADLISWGAIGARTTESQVHRELSSGLSFPIGFKNGTTGNIKIAVDAIVAAASPHSFLGVTHQGLAAIVETKGNDDCHLILRGSDQGPNYSPQHIASAASGLATAKIAISIMVDCSHGNSSKNYKNQSIVVKSIAEQLSGDDSSHAFAITGVMIESNLKAGNQSFEPGKHKVEDLVYGQSITDACIDWDETEQVLRQLAAAVRTRREKAKNKPQTK